mmetsp:Transcript_6252/g.4444  ORF Transcript_6252/g.4444 Transcript_6252/m.4444 type:complete len:245 (-) Transcript_6252:121-855(-)
MDVKTTFNFLFSPRLFSDVRAVVEHHQTISLIFHVSKTKTCDLVNNFTVIISSKIEVLIFIITHSRGDFNLVIDFNRMQAQTSSNILNTSIMSSVSLRPEHNLLSAPLIIRSTRATQALLASSILENQTVLRIFNIIKAVRVLQLFKLLVEVICLTLCHDIVVVLGINTSQTLIIFVPDGTIETIFHLLGVRDHFLSLAKVLQTFNPLIFESTTGLIHGPDVSGVFGLAVRAVRSGISVYNHAK